MKNNPIFSLHTIAGTAYLLPHGQGIADHRRGIRLNKTGVFLWKMLHHIHDEQELLACFADYCDASESELPLLKQDLTDFLNRLFSLGILLDDHPVKSHPLPTADDSLFLQIGPLCIHLIGPAESFAEELLAFRTDKTACADLTIVLRNTLPLSEEPMLPLIQNPELCVFETTDRYVLKFPQMPQITGATLSKSGTNAVVFYNPPVCKSFSADLFHVIRFLYVYTAQKHGCFVLHSASVIYNKSAWLFSGQSGMGKSTHTNLWKELYHVPIFNGDLNLIAIRDNLPVIYGLPWCGTSGISHTGVCPLGGIVLLRQSTQDTCIELPGDQKILLTAQRLISPAWDVHMLRCNLDFMSVLAEKIRICMLQCTKNHSAAETVKQWIDQNPDCAKKR